MSDYLFTAAQAKELDRIAIEELGIPSITLMKRAGESVLKEILQSYPSILLNRQLLTVFCGAGNNAGDGYIVAGLAAEKRIPIVVVAVSDPRKLSGDAAKAYRFARDAGVDVSIFNEQIDIAPGIIVDALLGIGLTRAVGGEYLAAIKKINASTFPVVSIDIPSGLSADTGMPMDECIVADKTVTFIGLKRGLYTGAGPAKVGKIVFDDLVAGAFDDTEFNQSICSRVSALSDVVVEKRSDEKNNVEKILSQLPPRSLDAHKGKFGHVLLIGGDHGMGGAVMMAAEAAARVGAGLISVATRSEHVAPLLTRRPEIMVRAVESSDDILPLLAKASVIVIGPGLGQSDWSKELLKLALLTDLPLVIDADALNLISRLAHDNNSSKQMHEKLKKENWVLTPHPGEAARLLGVHVGDVSVDRFKAVQNLQSKYGGVVVLKGVGSLVASRHSEKQQLQIVVNTSGNPGMATGGMGDVLSGIIGGLIAQHLSFKTAAELGVMLHGLAADKATSINGERGLLATDLFPHLGNLVNPSRE